MSEDERDDVVVSGSAVRSDAGDGNGNANGNDEGVVVHTRRRLIAIVVLAVFVVAAILALGNSGKQETGAPAVSADPGVPSSAAGPLRVFGGFPKATLPKVAAEEVVSSSLATFYNATAQPITITGFAPVGDDGVEVVGVKFAYDGPGFASYMGGKGFPQATALKKPDAKIFELAEINPVTPQGKAIEAKPPDNTVLWVIVGMKLKAGATKGDLAGVALKYNVGGGPEQTLEVRVAQTLCSTDGCA